MDSTNPVSTKPEIASQETTNPEFANTVSANMESANTVFANTESVCAGVDNRQRGDSYLSSQYSLGNRIHRQIWNTCWALFYRTSHRSAFGWRAWLLRRFGARLGAQCHFYPQSRIWAPWNLECEDAVIVADRADLNNHAHLYLASHAMISQDACISNATHDYNNPAFPVVSCPMRIGRYAWVAARACVVPGVDIGDGAVLGMASVATHDLDAWSVYAGAPAKKVKDRVRIA